MNLFVDHLDANNLKVPLTKKYVTNAMQSNHFFGTCFLCDQNVYYWQTKLLMVTLYFVTIYKILVNCNIVPRMC